MKNENERRFYSSQTLPLLPERLLVVRFHVFVFEFEFEKHVTGPTDIVIVTSVRHHPDGECTSAAAGPGRVCIRIRPRNARLTDTKTDATLHAVAAGTRALSQFNVLL